MQWESLADIIRHDAFENVSDIVTRVNHMQVICAEKARLVILKLSISAYFDLYMSIS